MKLHHLLKGLDIISLKGDKYIEISNISYDSRQLKPGGIFFAVKGSISNGVDFIDEAIDRGAVCIVTKEDFITYKSITKVFVDDVRKACAIIAKNFYKNPSKDVKVTGITGTNGKTTTLYLISAILHQAGIGCGMIGTVGYNIGERRIPAVNTTPSAIMLNMLLREMSNAKLTNCVMELSSHSLDQGRVEGIDFENAIFTNLTSEHLDYHKDMERYFTAKRRLFHMLSDNGKAIINVDDAYGRRISSEIKKDKITYGIKEEADVRAYDIKTTIKGLSFKVKVFNNEVNIISPLIGEYNVYNILSSIAFSIKNGLKIEVIEKAIRYFRGAPGRLERVSNPSNGFEVFVDYAHTDDALRNLLSGVRSIATKRIILLFGCGGDRDKTKRPKMAEAACSLADFVVITSDNPRSEEPSKIIDDIKSGIPKGFKDYSVFIDRKKAIKEALSIASDKDIVLIAGKGHEKYQVFKDTTIPFDDSAIAEEILNKKEARARI